VKAYFFSPRPEDENVSSDRVLPENLQIDFLYGEKKTDQVWYRLDIPISNIEKLELMDQF
jgi:hypothetical protein